MEPFYVSHHFGNKMQGLASSKEAAFDYLLQWSLFPNWVAEIIRFDWSRDSLPVIHDISTQSDPTLILRRMPWGNL